MKKSVCLMAILGALGSSVAHATGDDQLVTVPFKGTVIASNCVVNVLGDNNAVNLGTFNKTKKTAPIVPVTFVFSGCDQSQSVATVELKADGGLYPDLAKDKHTLSTDQKGLNIKLYSDSTGTPGMVDLGTVQNNALTGGEGRVTVAYAQMVETKVEEVKVQAVNSSGVFAVSFN